MPEQTLPNVVTQTVVRSQFMYCASISITMTEQVDQQSLEQDFRTILVCSLLFISLWLLAIAAERERFHTMNEINKFSNWEKDCC